MKTHSEPSELPQIAALGGSLEGASGQTLAAATVMIRNKELSDPKVVRSQIEAGSGLGEIFGKTDISVGFLHRRNKAGELKTGARHQGQNNKAVHTAEAE